jgi:hypothetical protein
MKKIVFACFCAVIFSCTDRSDASYAKSDLKKVDWLEGNWKGMDGQNPFYENYRFANDSTIEITSYEWNGTDSSGSSKTFVAWRNDAYYLEGGSSWKVTGITADSIAMIPHSKSSNTIVWKKNNQNGWDAILSSKKTTKVYTMEPFQMLPDSAARQ